MGFNLKDKKVFISGSSRGIGLSIAKRFLEEGAKVVINSRNADELKDVSSSLNNCFAVAGDLTETKEAKTVISKSVEILGGLDILICNVGSGSSVPPGEETYEEWLRIFDINFFSATNIIEASKKFLADSQGSIVCISSICGNETIPGAPITYSVAKSALNAYVKSISLPLAKDKIRINSVSPGNIYFEDSVWSKKMEKSPDSVKSMLKQNVPLEKFGTPEDVANLVVWLSSDLSNFVTGSVMTTDGGQTRS
tara:strand:+ start:1907 stop:2662 length:756 start_codon:yes stop_codon:yes gene_type:complete